MAIEEVTDWVTPARDNKAHHPTSPQGRDPGRISLSFQELQAAIARWRDAITLPVTATTTQLEDIADDINTNAAKELGYSVVNTTTGLTVFASGNTDGAVWHFYDSSTAHTPV